MMIYIFVKVTPKMCYIKHLSKPYRSIEWLKITQNIAQSPESEGMSVVVPNTRLFSFILVPVKKKKKGNEKKFW